MPWLYQGLASYDTLSQYTESMQIPRKWSGTLFNVVLHWYVQITAFLLEFMQQIDHEEHMDSSSYIDLCCYNVSSSGTGEEHKRSVLMTGMVTC
jgi:hypothetical protein